MQLLPEKNAVLVSPREPRRLAKIIPTAKLVRHNGRVRVAVPHRVEESRFLNNLGLNVPSPILTDYEWPRALSKIENPFEAQRLTAAMLTLNPRAFVLNDLGTGKSLSALWAYDYLRARGHAGKLLVICPLSTTERTWGDEIFFHFNHLEAAVLYGARAKRLKLLADQDPDVYIINHHGAQIIAKELERRPDITHVIVDEVAQAARNQRTVMWKNLNEIVNKQPCALGKRSCWGLTGTPIPNEPTDAYAQAKLVNPSQVQNVSFTRFRMHVMRQAGPYTWVPRGNAVDEAAKIMSPSIRFSREDCVDLPPTIYVTREAELNAEQKKAYKAMHDTLAAQIQAGEILAVNEAVKIGKLVQIACGVVYDDQKKEHTIGADSRVKATVEAIRESSSKTIVFVPYVSAIGYITDELIGVGMNFGVIHGGVSKRDRDDVFQRFQRDDDPMRVIVAQPAAMSHGLTLTAASTIVWYAPITSADIFEQANGRITRPGQKHTTVIVCIEGTAVERRIYSRLKTKQKMQNLLLTEKSYRE